MFDFINTYITNRFHPESKTDVMKSIGLHVFVLSGLVFGLYLFVAYFSGFYPDECLPGSISMMVIFGLALYGLRFMSLNWVMNVFYLVPVGVYYFFISELKSIVPNHLSINYSVYTLSAFIFFFLFFTDNKKCFSIFYVVSMATLYLHVHTAGLTEFLLQFNWPAGDGFINPFFVLTLAYVFSLVISVNYQYRINEMILQKDQTDKLISQTVRNLPYGMMMLELSKDEFGEPSDLYIRKTNLAFERIFRVTSRELKNQKAKDVFPKVFRGSISVKTHYSDELTESATFYLEHLDRHYDMRSYRIPGNRIISLFSDISAYKQQIAELQESKRRYQVLLEAIPDIFFIIDKEGFYVDFVFKASDTYQIKPEDIIGNSIFEVGFSERMSARIFQSIQQCIQNDTIETIEYALDMVGAAAKFEMRIVRLNDNSVISLARDITKRKIAEMELENARLKAEESDRLKTAFLNNISHEIRTPMNAIMGFSRMIVSRDYSDEEKSKFIEIVNANSKMLLGLINDMISLAKIESNTLTVKKSLCRIDDLMHFLFIEFSPDAIAKRTVTLRNDKSLASAKISFITDPALLKSIMQKLIDNGIKFTSHGEVEFGYRLTEPNLIELYVKDTGIGITEKDQERIFERFHQLDSGTTRAFEGTGLGLSLAQHYVRLLGGSLKVNSELGRGSTFYFCLPYEKEERSLKIVR